MTDVGRKGGCIACRFKLPDGLFELGCDVTQGITKLPYTKEESRLRHIEQVRRWQRDNPESFTEAQRRYYYNPDKAISAGYKNMPEEKKAKIRARQRRYYQANKEKILSQAREDYAKKKGWDSEAYDAA